MKKHVLILGATSDIAAAMAQEYGARGDHLMLAGRRLEALEEQAADLRVRHQVDVDIAIFDALDMNPHADWFAALPATPDLVVCAFGYLGDQVQAESDFNEARRILDTNFTGAVSILEQVAGAMQKQGHGTIIGISSVAGDRGRQSNYFYGAAKAGFTAYLSGLRNRLAPKGVHVLTVKPGFVRTAMTAHIELPPLVTAEPEQVAKASVRAADRGRNVIYSLWMWRWIMFIVRSIPESIFKKLST